MNPCILVNDPRINEGIKQCEADLDVALESFNVCIQFAVRLALYFAKHDLQIGANVLIDRSQNEIKHMIEARMEELRTVLFSVLRNPTNIARIAEMERAGDHVALPLMDAGQRVRLLFILNLIYTHRWCVISNLNWLQQS